MVWPKVRTRLKINQVVKNKNAIIEKGRNIFNFVCSLFFIIKTPPKDARTKPSSRGWWDQEISPSIPNRSWDKESPKPEIICTIEPAITSLIPVFNDAKDKIVINIFKKNFKSRKIIPINCSELIWGFGAIHCMTQQEPI